MARLTPDNIVFYDSDCGLCQRSVQMLLKLDKSKKLRFAPLNGDTANLVKKDFPEPWPDSLGYYTAGKLYFKSQAVAKALSSIGGPLIVPAYAIYFTPAFLANGVYDFVARNRKRWFSPTCILPSAETKNQFLL